MVESNRPRGGKDPCRVDYIDKETGRNRVRLRFYIRGVRNGCKKQFLVMFQGKELGCG